MLKLSYNVIHVFNAIVLIEEVMIVVGFYVGLACVLSFVSIGIVLYILFQY